MLRYRVVVAKHVGVAGHVQSGGERELLASKEDAQQHETAGECHHWQRAPPAGGQSSDRLRESGNSVNRAQRTRDYTPGSLTACTIN